MCTFTVTNNYKLQAASFELRAQKNNTMKTLLTTIILLFTTVTIYAQENFYVENGDIMWSKVFNKKPNTSQLAAQLSNVVKLDNSINGRLIDLRIDYKAQGYKRMKMPIFVTYPYCADVQIEFKDDRYRVTIRNIKFENYQTAMNALAEKSYDSLGLFLLDQNNNIKTNKTTALGLSVIDVDFTKRFSISNFMPDNW